MKRIIIPLISLVCFLPLSAVSQQEEGVNTDSLQQVVKTTGDDAQKFEALFALHKAVKAQEPQKAEEYANKALELARQMGDELKEARVIKETSKPLLANYQFETFDSIVHTIIPVFETHNETELLGDCYNNLGTSQFYRGNVVKAEEYYHQALELYDPDSWVWASTRLNTVFLMQTQALRDVQIRLGRVWPAGCLPHQEHGRLRSPGRGSPPFRFVCRASGSSCPARQLFEHHELSGFCAGSSGGEWPL